MRYFTIVIIILRNFEIFLRDVFGLNLRPYKALLELTEYCNSKCDTCHIWKSESGVIKNNLNIEDAENYLKYYGQNLLWIALSGGEITLYSQIDRLAEAMAKHCKSLRIVTFTTNGLQPDKILQIAKYFKNKYDFFVTISLDGDEATHDKIRGIQGNYELAQNTYRLLNEAGINTHFGLTVSDLNTDFIKNQYYKFSKKMRAISFLHSLGIYKTENLINSKVMIESIEVTQKLYRPQNAGEIIEWIYIALAKSFFKNEKTPIPCSALSTQIHIRPNGAIHPCMYLPAAGHINNPEASTNRSIQALSLQNIKKLNCSNCWMNCYAPHSMMRHPIKTVLALLR
jgi:MoaA/NifB/PqqE/SkfB family radical SAM enzyme